MHKLGVLWRARVPNQVTEKRKLVFSLVARRRQRGLRARGQGQEAAGGRRHVRPHLALHFPDEQGVAREAAQRATLGGHRKRKCSHSFEFPMSVACYFVAGLDGFDPHAINMPRLLRLRRVFMMEYMKAARGAAPPLGVTLAGTPQAWERYLTFRGARYLSDLKTLLDANAKTLATMGPCVLDVHEHFEELIEQVVIPKLGICEEDVVAARGWNESSMSHVVPSLLVHVLEQLVAAPSPPVSAKECPPPIDSRPN